VILQFPFYGGIALTIGLILGASSLLQG